MTRGRKQVAGSVGEVALSTAHELGNVLGALQLRLQILDGDPACRRAQRKNLDAMKRILEEANTLVRRVQSLGVPVSGGPARRRSRP
jgi:hypothetical protein